MTYWQEVATRLQILPSAILYGSCIGLTMGTFYNIDKYYFLNNLTKNKFKYICRIIFVTALGGLVGYYFCPWSILIYIIGNKICDHCIDLKYQQKKSLLGNLTILKIYCKKLQEQDEAFKRYLEKNENTTD